MKKLLGTTALVAAAFATAPAMAADKINIKVGGYFVGAISAVFDSDAGVPLAAGTDQRTIRFARESEVHFKGSTHHHRNIRPAPAWRCRHPLYLRGVRTKEKGGPKDPPFPKYRVV